MAVADIDSGSICPVIPASGCCARCGLGDGCGCGIWCRTGPAAEPGTIRGRVALTLAALASGHRHICCGRLGPGDAEGGDCQTRGRVSWSALTVLEHPHRRCASAGRPRSCKRCPPTWVPGPHTSCTQIFGAAPAGPGLPGTARLPFPRAAAGMAGRRQARLRSHRRRRGPASAAGARPRPAGHLAACRPFGRPTVQLLDAQAGLGAGFNVSATCWPRS